MATNPVYLKKEEKKKKSKALVVFIAIGILIVLLFAVAIFAFHLTDVSYNGNSYYSAEELNSLLLSDNMSGNSIYVYLKYKYFVKPDIPFMNSMDIKMISPSSIRFDITEKVTAGCVDYMGTYMYFDNEGYVVGSSSELDEGIPVITGLVFDHVMVGEKLDVENEDVFETILSLTQLLIKNKLKPDEVNFDSKGNIKLRFNQARVFLGGADNLKLKVADTATILPNIIDKKGELHIEDYNGDSNGMAFKLDDQ